MPEKREFMNRFLVEIFNDILRTEEKCLAECGYGNLSIRELHVIEAVCLGTANGHNTVGDIAALLGVVPGTLTTAVNILEKKNYLIREKDTADKRIVRIFPTPEGMKANADHSNFHAQMIDTIQEALTLDEQIVFVKALGSVADFFNNKKHL
ncbi:MAG: MarR family transcriptional regulator [Firmicutes bacterium]|nr:MarR family transcriptional regulator [Bacillota bacterium]